MTMTLSRRMTIASLTPPRFANPDGLGVRHSTSRQPGAPLTFAGSFRPALSFEQAADRNTSRMDTAGGRPVRGLPSRRRARPEDTRLHRHALDLVRPQWR